MLPVIELLFASVVSAGTPALSAVTVGHTAGSCPSTAATIVPAWTVTNPDDALYELHILENGVLAATQLCSSTSYTKTVTGFLEDGPYRRFTSAWTYTVQLVRKSDGVVLVSRVAAEWAVIYGACDAFVS